VSATLALLFGIALLAATAWCPPRLTRVLGSLLFALVVGVVLRFAFGISLAIVCALVAERLVFVSCRCWSCGVWCSWCPRWCC